MTKASDIWLPLLAIPIYLLCVRIAFDYVYVSEIRESLPRYQDFSIRGAIHLLIGGCIFASPLFRSIRSEIWITFTNKAKFNWVIFIVGFAILATGFVTNRGMEFYGLYTKEYSPEFILPFRLFHLLTNATTESIFVFLPLLLTRTAFIEKYGPWKWKTLIFGIFLIFIAYHIDKWHSISLWAAAFFLFNTFHVAVKQHSILWPIFFHCLWNLFSAIHRLGWGHVLEVFSIDTVIYLIVWSTFVFSPLIILHGHKLKRLIPKPK